MVVLRATRKVLRVLSPSRAEPPASQTALGDWYVNRLVVDRRPLLLLVSSESLLTIVTPAREVRSLPRRLAAMVHARLVRLDVADGLVQAEVAAMNPVEVGPTTSRSVVGSMVDFAKAIPFYLPELAWDETALPFVEARLATTPCRVTGRFEDTLWPQEKARQLLTERWAHSDAPRGLV